MSLKLKSWFRAKFSSGSNGAATGGGREPSLAEVLLMLGMMFAVHLWATCRVGSFWGRAATWFDNQCYLELVTIIRDWYSPRADISQHFWGFPYAITLVSKLFAIQALTALVLISALASLAVCILVHRLYGGWVAAAFIFINYEWIQLAVNGGSEPLFMCLLYASFLAARSDRWNLAAFLAALSTTVRPVGIFALLCFAVILARQRNYKRLAIITMIGLAIGVLYIVPPWIIMGTPLVSFHGYTQCWGTYNWPLTYPMGAWISSFLAGLHGNTRWYSLAFFAVWPVLAVAGIVATWLPRNRQRFSGYQPEALFATIYTLFFLSYTDGVLDASFTRFLIPVLPLLLLALSDWIPRDRRLLWAGALVSALLSAAPIVHFKNVFGFPLP
jgi:Gpi18-like mannosyltransferase